MLDLLNANADPALDRLTRIAAASIGMPIALVTFVGPDGHWIPSRVGWDTGFLPLPESFCSDAVVKPQLMEIPDAQTDERFRNHPLVTGPRRIRFYAGHPIAFDGVLLGTVSVLDHVPRTLSDDDRKVLTDLAGMVGDLLQLRDRERRLREEELALQQSEERYRRIVETAVEGVWVIDGRANTTFVNLAMAQMLGSTVEEMLGTSMFDYIDDGERLSAQSNMQRRADGVAEHHDFVFRRRDGSHVRTSLATTPITSADGSFNGALAMVTDVTQRREAEDALRRSEARFRALTALSSDWYWELDEELRLSKISSGPNADFEATMRRRFGMHPWDIPETDTDEASWERYRDDLAQRRPFRDFELRHHIGDTTLVMSTSGEPVFDEKGRFCGYRGVGRDVTEQRRILARQNELAAQLREAQKMEAIGVLAGGIAHDFNNVLAGILGNTALALEDLAPAHPSVSILQQVYKSGLRGRELVKQILSFARRQPQQLADLDLRALVEETCSLMRATLPASVSLELRAGGPLHVLADATQIGQVLMNLCTNAWHAIGDPGGRVSITLDRVEASTEDGHGVSLAPGSYARLDVSDTGCGMDEATQLRIFEPFFTTKPVGHGTGLGLSVAHGIVAAHGGAMSVDSAPGIGTTFRVYLPVHVATQRAELPTSVLPEPSPMGQGEQVMYIDDDDVMVVMVERHLQRLGYRVETFLDPQQAMEALRADPHTVDIVVTDFNMPGMSGLDVAREVRAMRADLPVVISSGNFPLHLQEESRRAGVRALMQKQHTLEELGGLIQLVLAGGARISHWADLGEPEPPANV
jgi:PAS domain S-box-containing protein